MFVPPLALSGIACLAPAPEFVKSHILAFPYPNCDHLGCPVELQRPTRVPGDFYDRVGWIGGQFLAGYGALHGVERLNGDFVRSPIPTTAACRGCWRRPMSD